MIGYVFAFSLCSLIISAVHFIFFVSDCTKNENKMAALIVELKRTKKDLTSERSKRIKAESDAAYYHDHYYIPEATNTPEYFNF